MIPETDGQAYVGMLASKVDWGISRRKGQSGEPIRRRPILTVLETSTSAKILVIHAPARRLDYSLRFRGLAPPGLCCGDALLEDRDTIAY